MEIKQAFGVALRNARLRRRLTQEDFHGICSRTYMSTLERGMRNPTIDKAAALAERLNIHPLTLLAETFLVLDPDADLASLLKTVIQQTEV
ncbi:MULTISPECIES: helix-turn-helix domain-containing protein [Pseudomonas]|uniref:helix-turn-helix domain-containing protein n=1 Tax=Pseudomonas TaxID=286 RepID=UPI000CD34D69|nr:MULTISPECIES: helix-turn-helix transcriptional regulator [Pseudomonas]MCA5973869.1 helix-turn-helix transcriptional regulator [Pseudomonas sp. P135]MCH5535930.1 helix-turn-helix domain-containing protein [Pseudomonas syringae pv. syringae]MCH5572106.1 helix-turn-helix domain-containing protein [Pseudomonas syringae pv. syringae]SOP99734.1 hypothetical protein CFBP4215_02727 [Pseudomonas syringae pv. syringae]